MSADATGTERREQNISLLAAAVQAPASVTILKVSPPAELPYGLLYKDTEKHIGKGHVW
jgi:hypothetical protein